jgi:6-pyruvoyltetrahydropterin/6-carboxytetrahydropterin synthase
VKVELTKSLYAEAAHRNPNGGPAQQRLHGHSYRIDLVAEGEVTSDLGWLVDFADIKRAFAPLHDRIDHGDLNEIDGLEDTRKEGLRRWILDQLQPKLPVLRDVRVVIEGDCAFRPVELPPEPVEGLPARLRFTFEAAQYLPQLPQEHPCRRLHGHSYRIEVAADDLRALRPELKEIYGLLDHTCLNEFSGLEQATCEVICQWLWKRLAPRVTDLRALAVQETDTARCIYRGP